MDMSSRQYFQTANNKSLDQTPSLNYTEEIIYDLEDSILLPQNDQAWNKIFSNQAREEKFVINDLKNK